MNASYLDFIELLGCSYIFGTFSVIISSNILSAPFSLSSSSETPIMSIQFCFYGVINMFWSFFFNLLHYCSSDMIISSPLSSSWLIPSSACSNLPLNPSSKFFISITVLYRSRISGVFFLSFLSSDISFLFMYHFLDFLQIILWFFLHI